MRDHPRMRGEHPSSRAALIATRGSSPHARGAQPSDLRAEGCEGIIPACAGSTLTFAVRNRIRRDHPRMRGEHSGIASCIWRATGSSPHARGARQVHRAHQKGCGIIPACAGSTRRARRFEHTRWDHPRMRGEHGILANADNAHYGIIPACAGSTGYAA